MPESMIDAVFVTVGVVLFGNLLYHEWRWASRRRNKQSQNGAIHA